MREDIRKIVSDCTSNLSSNLETLIKASAGHDYDPSRVSATINGRNETSYYCDEKFLFAVCPVKIHHPLERKDGSWTVTAAQEVIKTEKEGE